MTRADKIFIENCKAILASPFSDEGMHVRPKWADTNEPAHTKKCFGIVNRYDLREEFPIMTLRRIYWKTALNEVLWIYQKASNVIAELGSKIWDEWDVGDGTIGKAYGYQIGQIFKHHRCKSGEEFDDIKYPSMKVKDGFVHLNQMDAVLFDLRNDPLTRRIITNTYNHQDLHAMGLSPCAYSMTYNVTRNPETGEMILNGILNQRSQDMLTANNWNTVQYALLLMIVAKSVGMIPGEFIHVITDAHIYDRHIPIVEDMIRRAEENPNDFKAPTVTLKDFGDFYDFKSSDVVMEGYQYDDTDYKIDVAV